MNNTRTKRNHQNLPEAPGSPLRFTSASRLTASLDESGRSRTNNPVTVKLETDTHTAEPGENLRLSKNTKKRMRAEWRFTQQRSTTPVHHRLLTDRMTKLQKLHSPEENASRA